MDIPTFQAPRPNKQAVPHVVSRHQHSDGLTHRYILLLTPACCRGYVTVNNKKLPTCPRLTWKREESVFAAGSCCRSFPAWRTPSPVRESGMQPAAQPAAQFLSSYERHTLAEIQKKKIWWSGGGVFGGDTIELGPDGYVFFLFLFIIFLFVFCGGRAAGREANGPRKVRKH